MKKFWSVELSANNWNDDTFTGSFEECLEYCQEKEYNVDGIEARLVEIDSDGYCYQIIDSYRY